MLILNAVRGVYCYLLDLCIARIKIWLWLLGSWGTHFPCRKWRWKLLCFCSCGGTSTEREQWWLLQVCSRISSTDGFRDGYAGGKESVLGVSDWDYNSCLMTNAFEWNSFYYKPRTSNFWKIEMRRFLMRICLQKS